MIRYGLRTMATGYVVGTLIVLAIMAGCALAGRQVSLFEYVLAPAVWLLVWAGFTFYSDPAATARRYVKAVYACWRHQFSGPHEYVRVEPDRLEPAGVAQRTPNAGGLGAGGAGSRDDPDSQAISDRVSSRCGKRLTLMRLRRGPRRDTSRRNFI